MSTRLLREQEGEPGRLWTRFVPTRWPAPARPWTDLASGTLGVSSGDGSVLAALLRVQVDDVLYLPPVPSELVAERDRLALAHAERGTPVLLQVLPGDAVPPSAEGIVVVLDPLPLLVERWRDGAAGAGAPASAALPATATVAAWPLVAGIAGEAVADAMTPLLRTRGVHTLHPIRLELSGRERRELGGELPEQRYLELFHGTAPAAPAIARIGAAHGMLPLFARPLPRPPLFGAANLRAAGELATAAELCLWLGEPESRAQALLHAARFAERATHDLAALARDGNLGVLPWLDGEARDVVSEAVRGERPRLVAELLGRVSG